LPIADIIKLAVSAPSADNSQSWQFIVDAGALFCSYRHRALAPDPFGAMGHASLISSGALLENIDAIIASHDSQAEWIFAPPSWQIVVNRVHQLPNISSQATERLLSRHTNRHPFSSLAYNDLLELPCSPNCRSITVTAHDKTKALGHAIMQASTVRFNCKELHEWLFSSIRWSPEEVESGTGLDINTLHLPPGGRTFMRWIAPWPRMEILNRFGVGKLMAVADAALVRESPAVMLLRIENCPEEAAESGRLMQRIWLELNARGIAVHPYYVLTDLFSRRKAKKIDPKWSSYTNNAISTAHEVLGMSPNERIHMLLRVGKPSCIPVRSKRLPVSAFLDAATCEQHNA